MRSHINNGMFKICRTKTKAQFNRLLVLVGERGEEGDNLGDGRGQGRGWYHPCNGSLLYLPGGGGAILLHALLFIKMEVLYQVSMKERNAFERE